MIDFRYSYLAAEQDPSEAPPLAPGSPESIQAELARVDWRAQVATANQLEKCSPTFSIEEAESGDLLWISAYGEPDSPEFICDFKYRTLKVRLFGLWSEIVTASVDARHVNGSEAERAAMLFLRQESIILIQMLAAAS